MSESASYLTITTETSAEAQLSCLSTFATRESPSGSGAFLCVSAKETWPKILHCAPSSQFLRRGVRKTHLHRFFPTGQGFFACLEAAQQGQPGQPLHPLGIPCIPWVSLPLNPCVKEYHTLSAVRPSGLMWFAVLQWVTAQMCCSEESRALCA